MGFGHGRALFFWVLMILSVSLPSHVNSCLFTAIIGIAVFNGKFANRNHVSLAVLPLLILILMGVFNSWGFPAYDVLKDVWHFSLPILTLLTGWILAEGFDAGALHKYLAHFATGLSGFILLKGGWLFVVEKVPFDDKYIWREAIGPADLTCVWGLLALVIFYAHAATNRQKKRKYLLMALVNLFAIWLTDSRTALVILLAGFFLVFLPPFIGAKRRLYWTAVSAATVLCLLVLGSGTGGVGSTSLGRLQNVIWEQFSFSFADQIDINQKFRAFEALAAINTYLSGNWWEMTIGFGFGKLIDLGTLVTLGVTGEKSEYQFIPILHNGYLYVLVKTGFIGFLLYMAFLVRQTISFIRVKVDAPGQFWRQIGLTIMIGTILGTMVMSGPFNNGSGEFFATFITLGMAMRICFPRRSLPSKHHETAIQVHPGALCNGE